MYKVKPGLRGQIHFSDKLAKGKHKSLKSPIEVANASQEQLEFLFKNNLSSYIVFDETDRPKKSNSTGSKPSTESPSD